MINLVTENKMNLLCHSFCGSGECGHDCGPGLTGFSTEGLTRSRDGDWDCGVI